MEKVLANYEIRAEVRLDGMQIVSDLDLASETVVRLMDILMLSWIVFKRNLEEKNTGMDIALAFLCSQATTRYRSISVNYRVDQIV